MTRRLYDKFITQLQTSVRVSGRRQRELLAGVRPADGQPPAGSVLVHPCAQPAAGPTVPSVPWASRMPPCRPVSSLGVCAWSAALDLRAQRGRGWASRCPPVPGAAPGAEEALTSGRFSGAVS